MHLKPIIISAVIVGFTTITKAQATIPFIQDDAAMFSKTAVAQATQVIRSEYQKNGYVIHVRTVSGTNDDPVKLAKSEFMRRHINGVEIVIAPDQRVDHEITAKDISTQTGSDIHDTIMTNMKDKNPDAALTKAVSIAVAAIEKTQLVTIIRNEKPSATELTSEASTSHLTTEKKSTEQHGNSFGWLIVLLSITGIGQTLFLWRKDQEKTLKNARESSRTPLDTTNDLIQSSLKSSRSEDYPVTPSAKSGMAKNIHPSQMEPLQTPSYGQPGYGYHGQSGYPPGLLINNQSSGSDMFTGMLMGEMIAEGGHRDHTEIIHDTQIIHDTPMTPADQSSQTSTGHDSGGNWESTPDSSPKESGGSWDTTSEPSNSNSSSSGGGWGSGSSDSGSSDSGGGW